MTFPKGTKLVIVDARDKNIKGFVEGAIVYSQGGTEGFTVVTAEKESNDYIAGDNFLGVKQDRFDSSGWLDERFQIVKEDV